MKTFSYFLITIFFAVCLALTLNNLDPGIRNNLNARNIIILSMFLFLTISFFYAFISSIFISNTEQILHILQAGLIGISVTLVLVLKILNLLSIPSFIILLIIYILSQITLIELNKK